MTITDDMLFECAPEALDLWLATLPKEADLPEVTFSWRFRRKMNKLIREQKRSARANQMFRTAKRTAAAALIVAACSFAALMTVEAYRAKLIEMVVQTLEDLTLFRSSSDAPPVEIELPEPMFGYMPAGMVKMEDEIAATGARFLLYENETGEYVELHLFRVSAAGGQTSIMDTEGAVQEKWVLHGQEALVNTKESVTTIIWSQGTIVYNLSGNLAPEEMKKIAENLKFF